VEFENHDHIHIDKHLIQRLRKSWPKRATVRGDYFDGTVEQSEFDPLLPDYPMKMLPFWDHPSFTRLDEQLKQQILTWGWLEYNKRTIHAEEKVANPAFELLMARRYPGVNGFDMRAVVQQSLIDEHFHSLMHYTAIEKTRELRNIDYNIMLPDSITYRRLLQTIDSVTTQWEKDTLILLWAIVSEISINAMLELLAKDNTIQPHHTKIALYHNRDEFAHASVLIEIAKTVYLHLSVKQRNFFIQYLPRAMSAFIEQDYSAWQGILQYFKIPKATEIIFDVKNNSITNPIIRDFSGLEKVVQLLDISDELEFDFYAYS